MSTNTDDETPIENDPANSILGKCILSTRWLLAPMYFGLTVTLLAYIFIFFKELYENLYVHIFSMTGEELLIVVLNLVDMVMIANLVVMTTIGGFSIFMSELYRGASKNWPRFLNNMTSGSLKVKMSASLVSVTSIALLKVFLDPAHVPVEELHTKLWIHLAFIGAMIIFSAVEYLAHPPHLSKH